MCECWGLRHGDSSACRDVFFSESVGLEVNARIVELLSRGTAVARYEACMSAFCCIRENVGSLLCICACVYDTWRLECTNHGLVEKFWDDPVLSPEVRAVVVCYTCYNCIIFSTGPQDGVLTPLVTPWCLTKLKLTLNVGLVVDLFPISVTVLGNICATSTTNIS